MLKVFVFDCIIFCAFRQSLQQWWLKKEVISWMQNWCLKIDWLFWLADRLKFLILEIRCSCYTKPSKWEASCNSVLLSEQLFYHIASTLIYRLSNVNVCVCALLSIVDINNFDQEMLIKYAWIYVSGGIDFIWTPTCNFFLISFFWRCNLNFP